MAFNGAAWNESLPTNSDLANEIDDYMRDIKIGVRSRMAIEHNWPSSQTATGSNGYHVYVSLTTQTAAPGLAYGTATQAAAIYAISSGTGVQTVVRNSAGYESVLMHNSYLGGGVVPKGGIIMWSGTIAAIPIGWALCDGSSGTPDLRDKFVIGAKQDDAGTPKTNVTGSLTQSGGADDVTLTTTELPAHTHTINGNASAGGTAGLSDSGWNGRASASGLGAATNSAGTGSAFSIMNPYYALAFIQKL